MYALRSALIMALTTISGTQAVAAERPNVLLICVDDLKPLLGCYGDKIVQTPNIDQLAARGMRFISAYCNQAVCAPSRNALLTGLRPQTLGIYDLETFFRNSRPDAVTLPQYFKSHGYRTEGLGKIYHMTQGNRDDVDSWTVPHWKPQARQYQIPGNRPKSREQLAKGKAYESADVADTAYPDGQIADEAIRRLQKAAASPAEPFFLAVGFLKPHLPFCAPQRYWDLYDPSEFALPKIKTPPAGAPKFAPTNSGELRGYADIPKKGELSQELIRTLIHGYHASVSYVDAQVGRIISTLGETGLADNTIIVLWGDHGWHLGDHGMWCKHTNYEQAARIPLIVVAPSVAGSGTVTSALVETVDIYPTLCSLAGLDLPEDLEGADFSVVLKDSAAKTKEAIFHVYPRGRRLGRAVRTDRYRLVEWKRFKADAPAIAYELYDYETDPEETKNLAEERPEVVNELKAILAAQPAAKPPIVARSQVN